MSVLVVNCGATPVDGAPTLTAEPAVAPTLAAPTLPPPTNTPNTPPTLLPTVAPTSPPTVAPTSPPTQPPTPTAAPVVSPPTATPPLPLTREERRQIFDEVWLLVRDHYLYADFNGTDWVDAYNRYAPRVAAAQNNDQFYADVAEMISLLQDSHSRFVPPVAAVAQDAYVSGREVTVGIGVVTIPTQDGAFIQLVFPDSPAALVDLRPRDRIIGIDGRPYRYEDGDVHGAAGSEVRLNVVRPGEKPRDVVLVRQEVQGRIVPAYRRFPGDIGYVGISTLWVNDMNAQVSGALTELVAAGPLNGLILDLRGNVGGWRHVLSGILGHFVRGQVGKFYDRSQVEALTVSAPAGPDLRGIPLVVLVDRDTASYAEVLAAVLQHEANATLIGTSSAGNTETIYPYTLKDGSRLWLAQEGFRLQNDESLEGRGVQPDLLIDIDWKDFSEEDDPHLLEALRVLGAGPK